ncbi:serine/threonine-protein kinase LMTK3-like isoform X2 [Phacochoerus africanus]|uniref:serine/threonine-protein kinase LMTK3-like isoform X2 n=1 Tax=Phacochoerus africanus TaxID=41426 RepID=UPI001FD9555A|nr:serine/threonine-protein kinase LMTK3-like isoform X2 [Phacochoerus africanus]
MNMRTKGSKAGSPRVRAWLGRTRPCPRAHVPPSRARTALRARGSSAPECRARPGSLLRGHQEAAEPGRRPGARPPTAPPSLGPGGGAGSLDGSGACARGTPEGPPRPRSAPRPERAQSPRPMEGDHGRPDSRSPGRTALSSWPVVDSLQRALHSFQRTSPIPKRGAAHPKFASSSRTRWPRPRPSLLPTPDLLP